jgi:L-proline amide hydrolase
LYDQLGCGNSTHLQEKNGDTSFWTVQLFINEFNNLVKHFKLTSYDILGQSWGGMLASEIALTHPPGLNKVIISNSPASMKDWVATAAKLKAALPTDVRDTIDKHERDGTYDDPEFEKACLVFYNRHVCRCDPWPQDVIDAFHNLDEDKTVYMTMNGPSEFTVVGSLKNWSVKGKLSRIQNEVLLLNGRYDEATDETVRPFWEEIGGKVRWYTFAEGSHMPMWEERGRYMEVVADFLQHSRE